MQPIAILASGMVTGVGLNAPSSCAAIRCAINNFTETRFMDNGGEWIIGSQVPLEKPWRGRAKLVHMAVPAIRECLAQTNGARSESIPLLLCVAEEQRPGRLDGLNDLLFQEIQTELGVRFHPGSGTIPRGHVAGALAMLQARRLLYDERVPYCIIAGVDSLLVAATLDAYQAQNRLLTSTNSNGFIPGEAACAILVALPGQSKSHSALPPNTSATRSRETYSNHPTDYSNRPADPYANRLTDTYSRRTDDNYSNRPSNTASNPSPEQELLCVGIGTGHEAATLDSEQPLRADGLVQAFRAAFAEANLTIADIDYRITDANGEQYWFKEAALAVARTLRVTKQGFAIWHPVDCIGEIGAAIGPCALSVGLVATRKKYSAGRGPLCHFGGDDGERLALVLSGTGSIYNADANGAVN